jgi:tRNA G46 methylase TrmB
MHDHRSGAKQPHPFDPARAALLDDRSRFQYLPPAALIALLDLNVADTLVDFGSGTGTYAIEIARARPDVQVLAFDENRTMLELTREKLRSAHLPNITAVTPSLTASAVEQIAFSPSTSCTNSVTTCSWSCARC